MKNTNNSSASTSSTFNKFMDYLDTINRWLTLVQFIISLSYGAFDVFALIEILLEFSEYIEDVKKLYKFFTKESKS